MIRPKTKNYYTVKGSGSKFDIEISRCCRSVGNYQDELIKNAQFISKNTDKKIYVFYSGGLDSEYVLRIFLHLNIKIIPVIVCLEPNYNSFDTIYAYNFCKKYNLEPLIINFDFDSFVYSGEFLEIAKSAKCIVYQYPVFLKLSREIDGTIIFGSDQPHLFKDDDTEIWYFDERERIMSVWHNWFEQNNISGTPSFLNYSPETLLSFLHEPRVIDLISNKVAGRKGTSSSKFMIYNRHFKDIESRSKYDGFEIIRSSKIFDHPDIQSVKTDPFDHNIDHNGYFKIPYHDLTQLLIKNEV